MRDTQKILNIERQHISELAKGFQNLGIELDPENNDNHYVGLRKILETCVSYANEAEKDPELFYYMGLSKTTSKKF